MKPFFSIIIPTLNEELFLPNLLGNLQKQTKKNFEVIIVDSCSEDNTKKEASRFKKLPIRFYEDKRRNVSYQRNLGAKYAKGTYLIFFDADTQVGPSFTSKLERIIIKKKGLFFLPRFEIDVKDPDMKVGIDLLNRIYQISQNLSRPFAAGGAMIFEKNYFFLLGGFDERLQFNEDTDLARRSVHWNVRAKFLKEIGVVYSLRRFQREGKLRTLYKYLLAVINNWTGNAGKKSFEYEMGGHLYQNVHRVKPFEKVRAALLKFLNE